MKTLGKISAKLITQLYDENRTVFALDDVIRIHRTSPETAAKLVFDLVKRKIVYRLKKGKYIIIPQELGSVDKYIGNWYVAGREIVNSPNYYIAFYSAMKYWGMTTQPIFKIFVVTPKRQPVPQAMVEKFSFVYVNKKYIWGVKEVWITKTEKVKISDMEKTIIDALAHPEYCGGMSEIAKGIWLVKEKINFTRLIKYVRKYNKNVVAKRLGYILELLDIKKEDVIIELKKFIRKRYDLFDPTIEKKVVEKNKWRLIENVGREQIRKIISY
jgi:predicted transcriptional regulator of viral defense system